jgi:hypothetical protein
MTAVATVPSTDITGLGTMSTQNANAVAITGGTINGTTIGATVPSTVNATTITGQTGVLRGTGSNLILRSEALATSPWLNSGLTSITNNTTDVTDPLGGNTATKIVGSSSPTVFQLFTLNPIVYTFSIYLRTFSGTVSTRIITYLAASPFTTIGSNTVTVTNTWQRFTFTTSAPPSAASYGFQIDNFGANTIYAWGAQGEVGSTANTYIPTTTTAVYGTPTLSFSGVSTIGLESNGALFVQPAGTGALQAQATTSSATGGNARGARAVDWQTERDIASRVASATSSVVSGGSFNTASSQFGLVAGGGVNTTSGFAGVVSGGYNNTASGIYAGVGGGQTNTASGYYGFVGNGFTNSTTSNSAVTTQSGTMNATTAVTLSGSNANIKVGQYITGTSIAGDTYVAAISGTALTLSKVASGSSTSTLSFFTPHGVVVGGGNNQATGSYSFIGGGGDAGTAANRNSAAGDWSSVVGGFKNTIASTSPYSVIAGGFTNSITGNGYSFLGGGILHSISSDYASILGGYQNSANGRFSSVLGGGIGITRSIAGNQVSPASFNPLNTGLSGQVQSAVLVLARQTTDATPTVLCSNSSAAGTTNQVILPNNSAYFFTGEVISGVTGGGNTKGWTIEGVIKRGANAAATTLVGSTVVSTYADVGAATWTIAVTADTTNGGLKVTFTGQAATTIRTVCQLRTTEMTY